MKIIVKPLTGKEIELEVNPDCDVEHLKQLIERRCNISVDQQRLVHLGKTLSDGLSLVNSNLKDGSKIHLFVKKTEEPRKMSSLDLALVNILRHHLNREDVDRVVTEFHNELQSAFKTYSLDDLERMAAHFLGQSSH